THFHKFEEYMSALDRVITTFKTGPERVRQRFRRRPNQFIERLQEQCRINMEATQALIDYMAKPSKKNAQRVRHLEKEADEMRRILIDELNRTFVTPIDREDIHSLS